MNSNSTPKFKSPSEKEAHFAHSRSACYSIRRALQVLSAKKQMRESKIKELRREIAIGLKDVQEGRITLITKNTFNEIIFEGRKKLAALKKAEKASKGKTRAE